MCSVHNGMKFLCRIYFKKEMEALESPGLLVELYRAANSDEEVEKEKGDKLVARTTVTFGE